MSQSQTCIRKLRASPLQNIIATSGESFICVGYNHPKERQVPQDRFCHCWKNNSADEHGHWDRRAQSPAGVDGLEASGYDDLWLWFGASHSAWLTLPRSLMHSMPDDWQKQMAGLLDQWDAAWNTAHLPAPYVSARDGAKFTRWPEWLLNYRHPAKDEIDAVRAPQPAFNFGGLVIDNFAGGGGVQHE